MVPQRVNSDDPPRLRKMTRVLAYFALCCLCAGFAGGRSAHSKESRATEHLHRKNVLVLIPANLGFEGQMTFMERLNEELEAPETVELHTESIDLVKLKDPVKARELQAIYRTKYKAIKIDLIIAGQRPVLEFLLKRRSTLFPGVPIIFGMIPKDMPTPAVKSPGVTGSVAAIDFRKTVELALALRPDTKRVILISGTSARDRWLQWIAKEQLRPLAERVDFVYWEGLTPAEAIERFKNLAATDALFYLTESEDRVGHVYSLKQYLDRIAPESPVPIYGSLAQFLGHGIVGGNLYDNVQEAHAIAEQAKEILAGKSTEEIPISEVKMSSVVDWRQLPRWHIPVSRVPASTEIRFAEPTLWEKHKFGIVAVVTFIALETALICLLLIEVRRKNAARRMVERRFATERVVAEFSERFTHCVPEEVEANIQAGLEAIRRAKEVEWALWMAVQPGAGAITRTFLSQDELISPVDRLRLGDHTPWLMEQIEYGQTVALPSLRQMPERAREDRSYLESLGVESVLLIASNSNGDGKSALLLASREQGKEWTRALVGRLRTMANLFGTALHRHRAEVELKEKKEWLEMALEASGTALWELDVLTGMVRWSQRDDSLLGKMPMELELSWDRFLERVPEEDRDDLYRHTVATLEDRTGNDEFLREWRYHEPGGRERWVLFRGRVYRDARGRPLRLRGVNVDITELKQAKTELVELTERLIQTQESERQRLARELHDDIGQRLSLLIISLDRIRQDLPLDLRSPREELASSLEDASQLATDVHGLSHQLHSSKLKHLGLNAALRELCSQVSRQHAVEVNLRAETFSGIVSEERTLCLYRVAQEALNNAVKHSGSRRIEVELVPTESMLRLTVKDHGIGFDANRCPAGVGLASMRERIRMAAGRLHISSKPGEGTEIVSEVAMEPVARHAGAP